MLALLGLLAYLQYHWLRQISVGENERLKARLESDTKRFAEDFNREVKDVYFNFQIPAKTGRKKIGANLTSSSFFGKIKPLIPN